MQTMQSMRAVLSMDGVLLEEVHDRRQASRHSETVDPRPLHPTSRRRHVTVVPKQVASSCPHLLGCAWTPRRDKLLRRPGFSASCRHHLNRDKATAIYSLSTYR
jgi:hypothetical protein